MDAAVVWPLRATDIKHDFLHLAAATTASRHFTALGGLPRRCHRQPAAGLGRRRGDAEDSVKVLAAAIRTTHDTLGHIRRRTDQQLLGFVTFLAFVLVNRHIDTWCTNRMGLWTFYLIRLQWRVLPLKLLS